MFCYQLDTATKNLMDPPMVDSTLERIINDDDMPLIIVCSTNQIDTSLLLNEFGYLSLEDLLKGNTECDGSFCLSWGQHLNLTYDELISNVFDLNVVDKINVFQRDGGYITENGLAFIPAYGLCREISYFNISKQLNISNIYNYDSRVLIIDKNYRSSFMPDISTHVGSKIFINVRRDQYIEVKIQVKTNCNNGKVPMTRDAFEKCVDDQIQQEFKEQNISCVPPWLSSNNQCNETYPRDLFGTYNMEFLYDYVKKVLALDNIKQEINCRYSCKETTYVVNERDSLDSNFRGEAFINFNQKVEVKERLPNYDMFKYIIDVGSSLGLWLGLSILSLYDLIEITVQFFKHNFIIKKIRSAVYK